MDAEMGAFTASLTSRPIEFTLSDSAHLDYIAGLVRQHGLSSYEAPMPELMAWLVRMLGGYMLDVGANTGLFTLLAAAAHPTIKVCAFEPLDSVCKLLRTNLSLNPRLASRINVYQLGLSNVAGTFDFYETINDIGLVTTSSSLEIGHAQQVGPYRKQTVTTETLDGWATRLDGGRISIIKIDVEGHEYAVVEGGRDTIARNRPFITIEVLGESRVDRIQELLFEQNYLDFVITPTALRQCLSIRHHPDGWNHLLCPSDRVAFLLQGCRELNLGIELG
jgi:FkbM family methyltransferase